jgi:hypothetical protein
LIKARRILDEMKQKFGIEPDCSTYLHTLRAYCLSERLDQALELFQKIIRFTLLHRDNCTFHSLQHLHDLLIRQLREMVFGGKVCQINRNTLMLYNMNTGGAFKLRHEHADHQELKMITQLHDFHVVCCTNSRIYIWERDLSICICTPTKGPLNTGI